MIALGFGLVAFILSLYLLGSGILHLIACGMDWGSQSAEAQRKATRHVLPSIAKLVGSWVLAVAAGVLLS